MFKKIVYRQYFFRIFNREKLGKFGFASVYVTRVVSNKTINAWVNLVKKIDFTTL